MKFSWNSMFLSFSRHKIWCNSENSVSSLAIIWPEVCKPFQEWNKNVSLISHCETIMSVYHRGTHFMYIINSLEVLQEVTIRMTSGDPVKIPTSGAKILKLWMGESTPPSLLFRHIHLVLQKSRSAPWNAHLESRHPDTQSSGRRVLCYCSATHQHRSARLCSESNQNQHQGNATGNCKQLSYLQLLVPVRWNPSLDVLQRASRNAPDSVTSLGGFIHSFWELSKPSSLLSLLWPYRNRRGFLSFPGQERGNVTNSLLRQERWAPNPNAVAACWRLLQNHQRSSHPAGLASPLHNQEGSQAVWKFHP